MTGEREGTPRLLTLEEVLEEMERLTGSWLGFHKWIAAVRAHIKEDEARDARLKELEGTVFVCERQGDGVKARVVKP